MKKEKTAQPRREKTETSRTGLIRLAAAFAAILLLFGIGFFSVSILLDDSDYIEQEYSSLGVGEDMGITVPDLSLATRALFDYMKGRRDDIRVSVYRNGVKVDDLFYHEKEIVHMEEVRSLWSVLTISAILGIALAFALLAAILFFGKPNTRLRNTGTGLMIGTLIFAGVMVAAGLWAIGDFTSFWTVFHFVIFPMSLIEYLSGGMTIEAYNSLNWVFEPTFAMIQMLDKLFLPLVLRAGIAFLVEIAVMLLIGLLCYARGKRLAQTGSDIVEVRTVEEEERYVPIEDAPDLVLQHKLQNASLEQKKRMMEELQKSPEELAAEELRGVVSEQERTDTFLAEEPGQEATFVPFADVLPEEAAAFARPAEPEKESDSVDNPLF